MKILGNIDVDLDVVNKEYVDKLKNNLNNYVPLATYEDFTKTNDLRYNDFLEKIESKADKDHTHDEYVTRDYLTNSMVTLDEGLSERINFFAESMADKNHTHDEYLKKGEPITLTSTQKAELKGEKGDRGLTGPRGATGARGVTGATGPKGDDGTSVTTWTGTESQYNALSTKSSTTLYIITE